MVNSTNSVANSTNSVANSQLGFILLVHYEKYLNKIPISPMVLMNHTSNSFIGYYYHQISSRHLIFLVRYFYRKKQFPLDKGIDDSWNSD